MLSSVSYARPHSKSPPKNKYMNNICVLENFHFRIKTEGKTLAKIYDSWHHLHIKLSTFFRRVEWNKWNDTECTKFLIATVPLLRV